MSLPLWACPHSPAPVSCLLLVSLCILTSQILIWKMHMNATLWTTQRFNFLNLCLWEIYSPTGKAESPEPVFTTTFNSSPFYLATPSISLLPSSFLPQLCFHAMDVTWSSTIKAILYNPFKNPKICFALIGWLNNQPWKRRILWFLTWNNRHTVGRIILEARDETRSARLRWLKVLRASEYYSGSDGSNCTYDLSL